MARAPRLKMHSHLASYGDCTDSTVYKRVSRFECRVQGRVASMGDFSFNS